VSNLSAEATARRLVREIYSSAYRPDPAVLVSEWANSSRFLSSKTSRQVGKWENDRSTMLVEPMDCLSPQSPVRRVDIMGPAQFGKTEIGLNWVGHTIDLAPGPFLLVRPDLGLAKRFSRQRLDDMLQSCPSLKGKVSERKSRDKANTTLIKEFTGGLLVISGANSAAGLRDMPAAKAWLDEVDAYPADVDGEGDPAKLAINRTTSFGRRAKVLITSTPTIKDRSRIERGFNLGDRSRRFVPCPLCGHLQTLRFGQLKYTKDSRNVVGDVHYECEKCQGKILEYQKVEMLAGGKWIAEDPLKSSTHRSFHWNALYFPLGWLSWTDIAQEWVDIHHPRLDVDALRAFVNTRLAETYEEKGEAPQWQKLYRRREKYSSGTVPAGGLILTAGVDVQGDRLQGSVFAWGRELEHWLVDRFTIPGDTSTAEPWKALEEIRLKCMYKHASGAELQIRCLAVDTGFRFHAVCNWARTKPRTDVLAVKGSATVPFILGTPKQADVDLNGHKIARGVLLWPVGVSRVKEELYNWLNLEPPLEPEDPFPRGYVHFPEDVDDEYFQQLCAEELKPKRHRNGTVTFEWDKVRERNEALDEAVYARAAAYALGIDRWIEEDWATIEADLVPADGPERPARGTGDSSRRRGEYQGRFREWRGRKKT
jgi:phage terminase large subunit GpA-like protein